MNDFIQYAKMCVEQTAIFGARGLAGEGCCVFVGKL